MAKRKNVRNSKVKPPKQEEQEEKQIIELRIKSSLRKRPYGFLAEAGISTSGLSPREAWETWNDYQKSVRKGKSEKEQKPQTIITPMSAQIERHAPIKVIEPDSKTVKIPELSSSAISMANSNSHFERGTASEREYKSYANRILDMNISAGKKEKLLEELKKRWDKLLGYQASWVPWTVAGPARYNAKKLDKSEQVMSTSREISEWFDGVEKSVKNSTIQYKDESKKKAQKAEEWVQRAINSGWYTNPTTIANGLAEVALYDTKRFIELYESYDKKYHFRKNTNAAKIYEQAKVGTYKGEKKPQKLHETDNLNTYKKNIQAGERVFMKFTTRPKPQLIYALKRRGWHWNSNEGAWSIDSKKYDAKFVAGIDENYKKYL